MARALDELAALGVVFAYSPSVSMCTYNRSSQQSLEMMIQFLSITEEAMAKTEKQGVGSKRRKMLPLLCVGFETMPAEGTSHSHPFRFQGWPCHISPLCLFLFA